MKKIVSKISQAVQVLLLAPLKLPLKVMQVLNYVAVGLGIIESVLDTDKTEKTNRNDEHPSDHSDERHE